MKDTNEVAKKTDEKGQPMTYWGGKKESKCNCNDNTCDYREEQESIQILKEAKEQATEQKKLEEFALKYADGNGWNTLTIESVKAGAKWQAERSYSQEEAGELVYNIIGQYGKNYGIMIDGAKLNELFEQFKKK
jgi:hypothetical protein